MIKLTIAVVLALALPLLADQASTQPDVDALTNSLTQAFAELHDCSAPMTQLFTADGRQRAAVKMVPALKKVMGLLQQLASTSDDAAAQVAQTMPQLRVRLLILGDPQTVADVTRQAGGQDAEVADEARAELAVSAFFVAHGDAAGQIKALDEYAASLKDKANPDVIAWAGLFTQLEPANNDVSNHLLKVIQENVPPPDSDQIVQQITDMQKLTGLVNKPLIVSGKTVDGKAFTTADWKGKVVLVDFWATWCGPCVEEMPHVKQLYSQYHSKGFEIIGVSNDYSAADLNKFTQDQQMPWPQLFDPTNAAQQDWNPISKSLGVDAIPEMVIIDRQGLVRTVDGLSDADALVPKLLAEPAGK
ncbi:MAG TPA: TlpA disulfide reductase family protein [Tepidisphaeraceae bacterium]|nr:TlpA disulfide reductase family protein [Tepidisphaeraceae bacterium]